MKKLLKVLGTGGAVGFVVWWTAFRTRAPKAPKADLPKTPSVKTVPTKPTLGPDGEPTAP